MDRPWYQKLFSRSAEPSFEATQALAASGDAESQFGLGLKYSTGGGGVAELVRAAEWYRKAADQSHGMAQFNLGMMYQSGQGVPRDSAKARLWFDRAARQGDAGAQFQLGWSLQRASIEGPTSEASEARIEAYKWFHMAAAQGYKGSLEAHERVNMAMTRPEVTEGNQRVAALEATRESD